MTSLSKTRTPYRNQPANADEANVPISKQLCIIVGLACLAGFVFDMITLTMPLNLFDLPWRMNVLQLAGDRGILLLFGASLLLFSSFPNRRIVRPLSFVSIIIGVAFMVSCVLVIRDSLILRNQTVTNIGTQEEQLQAQIDQNRDNDNLPDEITPERLQQASSQLTERAESLKFDAKQNITRASFASIGNLLIVGIGLTGIGRLGLSRKRS